MSAQAQGAGPCPLLDLDGGVVGRICSKLDARSLHALYASCRALREAVPGHVHRLQFSIMERSMPSHGQGSKADVSHAKATRPSFGKHLRHGLHLTLIAGRAQQQKLGSRSGHQTTGSWSSSMGFFQEELAIMSLHGAPHDAQLARFFQAAPPGRSVHSCVNSLRLEDLDWGMKTAAALEAWPSFQQLNSFELQRCSQTGPVFWILAGCSNLQHLSIKQTQRMEDRALVSFYCTLKNLTSLTSLVLDQPKPSLENEDSQDSPAIFAEVPLPSLPRLQSLQIQNIGICGTPRIASIAALTTLTHLSLGTSAVHTLRQQQITPLVKGLPLLQSLELPAVEAAGLGEIAAHATALTRLVLNNQHASVCSPKPCTQLRSLVLNSGEVSRTTRLVVSLAAKDSLAQLHLRQQQPQPQLLGRPMVQAIAERFKGLQDLQLPGATSQGISVLLSLRGLTRLVLGSAASPPLLPAPPTASRKADSGDTGAQGTVSAAGLQGSSSAGAHAHVGSSTAPTDAMSRSTGAPEPGTAGSSTAAANGSMQDQSLPAMVQQHLRLGDEEVSSRASSVDGGSSVAFSIVSIMSSEAAAATPATLASALPTTLRVLSIGTLFVQWGEFSGLAWLTPCLPWLHSLSIDVLNIKPSTLGPDPGHASEYVRIKQDVAALAAHYSARQVAPASQAITLMPSVPDYVSCLSGYSLYGSTFSRPLRDRFHLTSWPHLHGPGILDGFETEGSTQGAAGGGPRIGADVLDTTTGAGEGPSTSASTGPTTSGTAVRDVPRTRQTYGPDLGLLEALLPLRMYATSVQPWAPLIH